MLLRYPGGKSKLKKPILECLNKFPVPTEYREPFFGAGSIGLAFLEKNKAAKTVKTIWINDKDFTLACLWTSLLNYQISLKDLINSFSPSLKLYKQFKQELLSTICTIQSSKNDIINIGFKKLAIHQMSYSGLGVKAGGPIGGKNQTSAYSIRCRWSPDNLCHKIDKYNNLLCQTYIRYQQCTYYDFEKVIQLEGENVLLYLDPPYYNKGNQLYQYGMSIYDHKRLSRVLRTTPHNWLLSYDDAPEIRTLYNWANIEEIDVNYTINTSRTKKELLISK